MARVGQLEFSGIGGVEQIIRRIHATENVRVARDEVSLAVDKCEVRSGGGGGGEPAGGGL